MKRQTEWSETQASQGPFAQVLIRRLVDSANLLDNRGLIKVPSTMR